VETNIPLVWFVSMGIAFGLFLGFAIGMAMGISRGRHQLLKKIRLLLSMKKLDIDIDKLLDSREAKRIKEDFLW